MFKSDQCQVCFPYSKHHTLSISSCEKKDLVLSAKRKDCWMLEEAAIKLIAKPAAIAANWLQPKQGKIITNTQTKCQAHRFIKILGWSDLYICMKHQTTSQFRVCFLDHQITSVHLTVKSRIVQSDNNIKGNNNKTNSPFVDI